MIKRIETTHNIDLSKKFLKQNIKTNLYTTKSNNSMHNLKKAAYHHAHENQPEYRD